MASQVHVLDVAQNRISDTSQLGFLCQMVNCTHLNMQGNPIRRRRGFRLSVLLRLRSLLVLDEVNVLPEERAKADYSHQQITVPAEIAKRTTLLNADSDSACAQHETLRVSTRTLHTSRDAAINPDKTDAGSKKQRNATVSPTHQRSRSLPVSDSRTELSLTSMSLGVGNSTNNSSAHDALDEAYSKANPKRSKIGCLRKRKMPRQMMRRPSFTLSQQSSLATLDFTGDHDKTVAEEPSSTPTTSNKDNENTSTLQKGSASPVYSDKAYEADEDENACVAESFAPGVSPLLEDVTCEADALLRQLHSRKRPTYIRAQGHKAPLSPQRRQRRSFLLRQRHNLAPAQLRHDEAFNERIRKAMHSLEALSLPRMQHSQPTQQSPLMRPGSGNSVKPQNRSRPGSSSSRHTHSTLSAVRRNRRGPTTRHRKRAAIVASVAHASAQHQGRFVSGMKLSRHIGTLERE
ncbi:MAG: hypothetical protein MHM6MM_004362 [Cercozoa sp. M6MM]